MRILPLIFAIVGLNISLQAQEKSLKSLIIELEENLSAHGNLSPFGQNFRALKEYGISKEDWASWYEEEELAVADSVDVYDLLAYFEELIGEAFLRVVNHPHFSADSLSPSFMVSSDGKFIQLSYFGNTGGSYKSNITYYYHTGLGEVNYQLLENVFGGFSTDGYGQIITLQGEKETQYLLLGGVVGCNTCISAYVDLFHFSDSTIVFDFSAEISTRLGISGFDFDQEAKELSIIWETSDLKPYCYCPTVTENITDEEETRDGGFDFDKDIKQCACTYVYTGKTFELKQHKFYKE